jgi:hypothetical protein
MVCEISGPTFPSYNNEREGNIPILPLAGNAW